MHLTREEERVLAGEEGEGKRKAMEILAALGDIYGADSLLPIERAQISGVSYKTIGDAGLEFLRDLADKGAEIGVLATLNPAGVDLEQWKELGYPRQFAEKQEEIIEAYSKMGAVPSCTCTPYLAENVPSRGEHIAFAESSSIAYANSVIGARTNRESGVSALAAAIIGKTPNYGLHLDENRKPDLRVEVTAELGEGADYSALGYYLGQNHDSVPLITGITPRKGEMKALGAAFAVGPGALFHVEGVTPEARKPGTGKALERIEVGEEELAEAYGQLSTTEEADLVCIGCPHLSRQEMQKVLKLKPERETWLFTSRQQRALLKDKIPKNTKLVCDTCMVVSPLEEIGVKSVATNSAKCAYYCRNLSGLEVKFGRLEELVR